MAEVASDVGREQVLGDTVGDVAQVVAERVGDGAVQASQGGLEAGHDVVAVALLNRREALEAVNGEDVVADAHDAGLEVERVGLAEGNVLLMETNVVEDDPSLLDRGANTAVVVGQAANRHGHARAGRDAVSLLVGTQAAASDAVVGGRGGTVDRDVVALVRVSAPAGVGDKGQAAAAVVVGGTARRNDDASLALVAPAVASGTHADTGGAIVGAGKRAVNGQVVASVVDFTPGGADVEGHAVAAAVAGVAARRDGDASAAGGAPTEAGLADAGAGGAVVGGEARARDRNGVARVGRGAPAEVGVEGDAVAAGVVGGATQGNAVASAAGGAPSEAGVAVALAGLAVVSGRAIVGHVVTTVSGGAPGGAGDEGGASGAVTVVHTAQRDGDARAAGRAPGLSGRAHTSASETIMG